VREIREGTNNDKLRCYRADFSSLDEVRRLAEEVRTNHAHLDVLVNNAGVLPENGSSPGTATS
jgi:NAD(P)-dependent dehydrogenase (short-subunit alcohol dehydrogenase family)